MPADRGRGGRHRQPGRDPLRSPRRSCRRHPGHARGTGPRPLPRRRQVEGRRHHRLSRCGRGAGRAPARPLGLRGLHRGRGAAAAGGPQGLCRTDEGRPAGDSRGRPGDHSRVLAAPDPDRGAGLDHAPVRAQPPRPRRRGGRAECEAPRRHGRDPRLHGPHPLRRRAPATPGLRRARGRRVDERGRDPARRHRNHHRPLRARGGPGLLQRAAGRVPCRREGQGRRHPRRHRHPAGPCRRGAGPRAARHGLRDHPGRGLHRPRPADHAAAQRRPGTGPRVPRDVALLRASLLVLGRGGPPRRLHGHHRGDGRVRLFLRHDHDGGPAHRGRPADGRRHRDRGEHRPPPPRRARSPRRGGHRHEGGGAGGARLVPHHRERLRGARVPARGHRVDPQGHADHPHPHPVVQPGRGVPHPASSPDGCVAGRGAARGRGFPGPVRRGPRPLHRRVRRAAGGRGGHLALPDRRAAAGPAARVHRDGGRREAQVPGLPRHRGQRPRGAAAASPGHTARPDRSGGGARDPGRPGGGGRVCTRPAGGAEPRAQCRGPVQPQRRRPRIGGPHRYRDRRPAPVRGAQRAARRRAGAVAAHGGRSARRRRAQVHRAPDRTGREADRYPARGRGSRGAEGRLDRASRMARRLSGDAGPLGRSSPRKTRGSAAASRWRACPRTQRVRGGGTASGRVPRPERGRGPDRAGGLRNQRPAFRPRPQQPRGPRPVHGDRAGG